MTVLEFTPSDAAAMLIKQEVVMRLTNRQLSDIHKAIECEIALRKIEKAAAEHGG